MTLTDALATHASVVNAPRQRGRRPQAIVRYSETGMCVDWFGRTSYKEALEQLLGHPLFEPHRTPIELLNRAVDPMLPQVKPDLFAMLRLLDDRKLTNHVLVNTSWWVEPEDCVVLNSLQHLKVTLLVRHSGIDDTRITTRSLRTAFTHAQQYRVVLDWQPIVPGVNDSDTELAHAASLGRSAHATVFAGLFTEHELRIYKRANGLDASREALHRAAPEQLEQRILDVASTTGTSPLFQKTSCAVSYAHGVADYNGHVGTRELCATCPLAQFDRCRAAHRRPGLLKAFAIADDLGGELMNVTERAVMVSGLAGDRRYRMQHLLGYQVRTTNRPRRHGYSGLSWPPAPITESEGGLR